MHRENGAFFVLFIPFILCKLAVGTKSFELALAERFIYGDCRGIGKVE